MRKILLITTLLALLTIIAISVHSYNSVKLITSCEPIGNARPLCGWQNPEDMVALPDGRHVIVSEYGGMNGESPGVLSLLDLETDTREVLYAGGSSQYAGAWGNPDCAEVAIGVFSPHGIHLGYRKDGRMQLLAVQHGGRESVELFEVEKTVESWTLHWRGGVIAPAGCTLNDVVATPEDGFLVTNMLPKKTSTLGQTYELIKAGVLGIQSGHVLAWHPNRGFSKLASSVGVMPNGIEISPDGEEVFINYSLRGEVRRINLNSDTIEMRNTSLPPLDNITWTPDGRLLVAGAIGNIMEMMACSNPEQGNCPGAFAILEVNPLTLETYTIYEGGYGTPSGAGTVGLMLQDGSMLIGTFAGDRIVKVKL